MRSTYKSLGTLLTVAALLVTGCSKKLEEHPYTAFTTEFFKTPAGLQDAVNAIYAGMRYDYGPNGALAIANVGTDEWTYGDQPRIGADGDVLVLGTYNNLTPSNGAIQTPWNRNYSHINLCNAVVDLAPGVEMDASARNVLLAEARYLRANYYLLLVEQFGAVPLDLGSGDLKFNTVPFTGFNRLPVAELLVKDYQAMIDDLIFATQNLPDKRPANAFKLSKAAAFCLLAKVYIFRAYSAAKQADDFQNAYNAAMQVINNKDQYGVDLLADYGDVHKQGNDYNKEILFSIERLPLNYTNNEVVNPGSDFSEKVNIANNMFNADYTGIEVPAGSGKKPVDRVLQYGRPLRRYCPTKWLLETAFADRVNDSRFDNSFRVMWRATNTNSPGIAVGDTAIYLPPTNRAADSMVALGTKPYRIIAPRDFYSNQHTALNIYPNLKKYDDSLRAAVNDVSGRPFVVSKFSELYLLAAEAALGAGRPADAVPLLNVLRERAAYRPGLSPAELAVRKAAMDITVSRVNLDFILDERTRELCGESQRWPDLAMRGKLVERVKAYNPDGGPNIQAFHVLRPIPKGQLDNVSAADKNQYQNPGY
jgi:hypothetical protein